MHIITKCPRCNEDFMYNRSDTQLVRNHGQIFICQDCDAKERELASKVFKSDLGRQLEVIYITSDNRPFIRLKEAKKHIKENDISDKLITEWYQDEY